MKTIVLAEKPSQASDYANAFQKHTKKQGYFEVSDPVLANETEVTTDISIQRETSLLIQR